MATKLPSLLLILLPLLLSLPRTSFRPHSQSQTPTPTPSGKHIVRFRRYLPADLHRRYLEGSGVTGWRWVERRNPAAPLPTDFAVVEIGDGRREEALAALAGLGSVRDVWADLSYSRGVLSGGAGEEQRPGKRFTRGSFEAEEGEGAAAKGNCSFTWERKLLMERSQITSMFGAETLWAKGYTGAKVKMAVFDTGIRADHPHFRNIKERTNWTNEDTLNDNLGHGTFVAGVIAGEDEECLGFAPNVEIYAFRVFTDAQFCLDLWIVWKERAKLFLVNKSMNSSEDLQ